MHICEYDWLCKPVYDDLVCAWVCEYVCYCSMSNQVERRLKASKCEIDDGMRMRMRMRKSSYGCGIINTFTQRLPSFVCMHRWQCWWIAFDYLCARNLEYGFIILIHTRVNHSICPCQKWQNWNPICRHLFRMTFLMYFGEPFHCMRFYWTYLNRSCNLFIGILPAIQTSAAKI